MKHWLICVNFFNYRETTEFLCTVKRVSRNQNVLIAVVDNTPKAHQPVHTVEYFDFHQQADEHCHIITTGENLGYFGGMRIGYEHLQTISNSLPDSVIVSNTDIEFFAADIFSDIESAVMRAPSNCAVIAPSIISSVTRRDQNPIAMRKPSRTKMRLLAMIFSVYPVAVAYRLMAIMKGRFLLRNRDNSRCNLPTTVYAGHGAFLILRAQYFLSGGTLNYPEFLFCEEFFVAEECRRLGYTIIHDPMIAVLHREHATTKTIFSPSTAFYACRSHQYCADNYY